MPDNDLSDDDVASIVAYIRELGGVVVDHRRGRDVVRRLLPALAVVVAVVGAASCGDDRQLVGLTRDPEPVVDVAPVPDVSRGGEPFRFVAPDDGLLVVFFGYTNCPDVCPTTLAELRRGLDELDGDDAERIDTAMVTIDPARDREVVADYIDSFVPGAHARGHRRRRRAATDHPRLRCQLSGDDEARTARSTSPTPTPGCSPSTTPGRSCSRGRTVRAATTSPATSNSCSPSGHETAARRGACQAQLPGRRRGIVAVLAPGVAHADPAVPTDFSTEIVAVEPETPAIDVGVVGGDSFVELTVERGTDVVVLGYWGEPYLHFASDGTVAENRRSPTVAENEDRYGSGTSSAADATGADSQWVTVATDGSYAWHDHRAHWMSTAPPSGARGQQVQTGVIPLQVNGADVDVSVAVTWEPAPSRVPVVAGAIVAGFAVLIVLSARYRVAWVLVIVAAAAAGIGWWQIVSVPPETGPSSIGWLLPAIAGAAAVVAISLGRSLISHGLVALAGLQLVLWAFLRRDGLVKALLPTDAPYWLDRGVTAAAAVVGAVGIVAGVLGALRLPAAEG